MDTSCSDNHLYPLTSLQIGDTKANLSQAFLYFASDSKKFLILVDNQSWRKMKHSKSTHIKAFVTTCRTSSPFRNTKPLQRSPSFRLFSPDFRLESLFKWLPNIVRKSFHGFIVFEVSWENVRGINYLNELQSDGIIALEVKSLTKREFSSVDQALSSTSSWFSGSESETQTLRTNLTRLLGKTTVPTEIEIESESERETISAIKYRDTLLQCRFDDRDLPSELRPIITSDLRLLTLHESGLPSWVVFLQSYPVLCALYRPWMRTVFRAMYVLASLVTVVIGFYDLYKNVPLLKSAVSRLLCGPIFKWIESWDMLSRIRYLGTMLFLQNLEKGVKLFLRFARWFKLSFSLLRETILAYPFEIISDLFAPFWSLFTTVLDSLCIAFDNLDDVLLAPFKFVSSYFSGLGTLFYPILSSFWELVLFASRGFLGLANYLSSLLYEVKEVFEDCFGFAVNVVSQLQHLVRGKPNSSDFSYWHSLWKDLFSKVFRSLQNVIRILCTFVASLTRHRLSIYNYVHTFVQNLGNQPICISSDACSSCQAPQSGDNTKVGGRECKHCKKVI